MSFDPDGTTEPLSKLLQSELSRVEERIRQDAQTLAEARERGEPNLQDVAEAYSQHVLGTAALEGQASLRDRVVSSISGITLVSAILAIIFGLLGYFATTGNADADARGLYDIAKIFAGAVVGSTGAAAAVSGKPARRRK